MTDISRRLRKRLGGVLDNQKTGEVISRDIIQKIRKLKNKKVKSILIEAWQHCDQFVDSRDEEFQFVDCMWLYIQEEIEGDGRDVPKEVYKFLETLSPTGGRLQSIEGGYLTGGLFIGGSDRLTNREILVAYFGCEGADNIIKSGEEHTTAGLIRDLWKQQSKCGVMAIPSMDELITEMKNENRSDTEIEQTVEEIMEFNPIDTSPQFLEEFSPPQEDVTAEDLTQVFETILGEPIVDELEEIVERRREVAFERDDEAPEQYLEEIREGIADNMIEDDLQNVMEMGISDIIEKATDIIEDVDIPVVNRIVENSNSVEDIVEKLFDLGLLSEDIEAGIMSGGLMVGGQVEDAKARMRLNKRRKRKVIKRKKKGGQLSEKEKKEVKEIVLETKKNGRTGQRSEAQKKVQEKNAERLREVQRIRKEKKVSLKEAWRIFREQ